MCTGIILCFPAVAAAATTDHRASIIQKPGADAARIFGLQQTKPVARTTKPAVKPQPPLLPGCERGSVMNIVAHQDDDILFMNPAVERALDAGVCMQTVYVTAGDAGQGTNYWLQRELGPRAAYAAMTDLPDSWQATDLNVSGRTLSVHTLVGRPNLALIFLRLPDGNLAGQGFTATEHTSLQKLRLGDIGSLESVDGISQYTDQDLAEVLLGLMRSYRPSTINLQAHGSDLALGDHSDHQSAGQYADRAAGAYHNGVKVHRYIGYQSGGMPNNLTEAEQHAKQTIFSAYQQWDSLICGTDGCPNGTGYEPYFGKLYEQATVTDVT